MESDAWHYPRPDLAERTFSVVEHGLASALILFAPRRTGKTQFLLHDLGPLAEAKGHHVVYANFWQAPVAPLATLLHAIENSQVSGTLWQRATSLRARLTPRLKLSGQLVSGGPQVGAEVDLGSLQGEPPSELLLYLDDLIGRTAARSPGQRARTILMLDDVQELALDAANRSLIASLRTSLDKRKDSLAVVFTGSSQDGLRRMFNEREAPFFHFATPINLPPLDAKFVDHLLQLVEKTTGRSLPRGEAHDAFAELHQSPYYFRSLLELLMTSPTLAIPAAVSEIRARAVVELGYPDTWIGLSELQRATALALANGVSQPYGDDGRTRIGALMSAEPPSASRVQAALRKLAALGVVDRSSGQWAIEDAEFARWVRQVAASDHGER